MKVTEVLNQLGGFDCEGIAQFRIEEADDTDIIEIFRPGEEDPSLDQCKETMCMVIWHLCCARVTLPAGEDGFTPDDQWYARSAEAVIQHFQQFEYVPSYIATSLQHFWELLTLARGKRHLGVPGDTKWEYNRPDDLVACQVDHCMLVETIKSVKTGLRVVGGPRQFKIMESLWQSENMFLRFANRELDQSRGFIHLMQLPSTPEIDQALEVVYDHR